MVLNVVTTPLRGGGPTLPLWGRVVTFLVVCFVLLIDLVRRRGMVWELTLVTHGCAVGIVRVDEAWYGN